MSTAVRWPSSHPFRWFVFVFKWGLFILRSGLCLHWLYLRWVWNKLWLLIADFLCNSVRDGNDSGRNAWFTESFQVSVAAKTLPFWIAGFWFNFWVKYVCLCGRKTNQDNVCIGFPPLPGFQGGTHNYAVAENKVLVIFPKTDGERILRKADLKESNCQIVSITTCIYTFNLLHLGSVDMCESSGWPACGICLWDASLWPWWTVGPRLPFGRLARRRHSSAGLKLNPSPARPAPTCPAPAPSTRWAMNLFIIGQIPSHYMTQCVVPAMHLFKESFRCLCTLALPELSKTSVKCFYVTEHAEHFSSTPWL